MLGQRCKLIFHTLGQRNANAIYNVVLRSVQRCKWKMHTLGQRNAKGLVQRWPNDSMLSGKALILTSPSAVSDPGLHYLPASLLFLRFGANSLSKCINNNHQSQQKRTLIILTPMTNVWSIWSRLNYKFWSKVTTTEQQLVMHIETRSISEIGRLARRFI